MEANDVNQEPSDPPSRGSYIESLIRRVEALYASHHFDTGNVSAVNEDSEIQGQNTEVPAVNEDSEIQGQNTEASGVNEDNEIQGQNTEVSGVNEDNEIQGQNTEVESDGGGFSDCNICLDVAREPILTCCGHLYCWPCFYRLPYLASTTRKCPVCEGDVADTDVTPIYCSETIRKLESDSIIPPRPKARRVESARWQRGMVFRPL